MKLIPLLLSTSMVLAERAGRKKMTRRLKGLEEYNENPDQFCIEPRDCKTGFQSFKWNGSRWLYWDDVKCPYGQPGDVLWVRENIRRRRIGAYWEKGMSEIIGCRPNYICEYLAGGVEYIFQWTMPVEKFRHNKIVPSIHMFLYECRLFLEIKSIRVERLHDITEQDAIDEGIQPYDLEVSKHNFFKNYLYTDATQCKATPWLDFPIESFESLWIKINGQPSWDVNPWVWVISFERTVNPKIN